MVERVIVATAGHIDHGKTSLVRALTGVDLDRLPEEAARGITIALGFCPLDLPDGGGVAFVDVPGHDRLVRTMIAGAHGVDAALLVVSAVEGVMPQTREHLAILDLLGVPQGIVVVTKADQVDEELLELAIDDARGLVAGTCLAGAPVVAFSAVTGQGREALLAALAALRPMARRREGPFRLPIDRAFVRAGFGTIVTGTSVAGRLAVGASAVLLPEGRAVRVRGVEVHGAAVDAAGPGMRVAVNLAGVEVDQVPRGTVLVVGEVPTPQVIDVRYDHVSDDAALEDGQPVRVLVGTSEALGRAWLPDGRGLVAAGERAWVQLRLDEPLPCLPGDKFVLRRPSPASTLGGGVVLDTWATRVRPRDAAAWVAELARLDGGDAAVFLERAGSAGVDAGVWAERGHAVGVKLGDRVVAPAVAEAAVAALRASLAAFHKANPLVRGASRAGCRVGVLRALTDRAWDGLLASEPDVVEEGPLVRLASHTVVLTPALRGLMDRVAATLAARGLVGVEWAELKATHKEPELEPVVALLAADQAVVNVGGVGLIDAAALARLRVWLRERFAAGAGLAPSDLKDGWELTRKTSVPLLEWTDKAGWTRRKGEGRVAGPALEAS